MVAEAVGLKQYNRVEDANKQTQASDVLKTRSREVNTVLESFQKVNSTEKKQSERDLDGITKDEVKKAIRREHLEKMFSLGVASKARELKAANKAAAEHIKNHPNGTDPDCPLCECEKCKNRRYQDKSNDSAVSFQQATRMRPEEAAYKVKTHEMEHVRREQYKASSEGNKIVSQSVQIHTAICEECGRTYVSGGTTRTYSRYQNADYTDLFRVGAEDMIKKGNKFAATG